jgi:hypothetical protein
MQTDQQEEQQQAGRMALRARMVVLRVQQQGHMAGPLALMGQHMGALLAHRMAGPQGVLMVDQQVGVRMESVHAEVGMCSRDACASTCGSIQQ